MSRPQTNALLFVDGYNIIGAWSDLQALGDRQPLETARQHLIEIMTNYSAFRGYHTRLVFDAHLRTTPNSQEAITEQVSVHYTHFGQTADSYIEIACAKFRRSIEKYHKRLIVATSDRAQQMTVVGYGAEWMSADQLAQDVLSTQNRLRRQQKPPQKSSRRFLANGLDPVSQKRLAALRLGLTPGK